MAPLLLKHYGWKTDDTAKAEHDLLDYLFTQQPAAPPNEQIPEPYEVFDVALPDGSRISTLRLPGCSTIEGVRPDIGTKKAPLLLLHGFGGGKSTWAPLLLKRSSSVLQERVVYAIDLPGMGCSSEFLPAHKKEWTTVFDEAEKALKRSDPDYAEALSSKTLQFYVQSIHSFMCEMSLAQVVILGHSLGARIGLEFASSHPHKVQKLILLSPVGLDSPASSGPTSQPANSEKHIPAPRQPKNLAESLIVYAWARYYVTPLSIIRLTGPMLPWVIGAFVRLSNLYGWVGKDKKLRRLIGRYTYGLIRRPSSAETLMPCFINGLGYGVLRAENPILEVLRSGVEVVCIRGSHDWVPEMQNQDELREQGLRLITLDKGGHSMHMSDIDRTWPLLEVEL